MPKPRLTAARRRGVFERRVGGAGKRERTRARLLDAAVEVLAARGVEAASVQEIAQLAEVVGGTFYNYFPDKEAIVSEVALRLLRTVVARIDAAMVGIDDAAWRVCFATRQFIELAASREAWGWALLRSIPTMYDLRHEVSAFARADLLRGVADGTFRVEVDDFLMDEFLSLTAAALYRRLSGASGVEAGAKVAEHQLRLLGVPPARARRLAGRPLPRLALDDEEALTPQIASRRSPRSRGARGSRPNSPHPSR